MGFGKKKETMAADTTPELDTSTGTAEDVEKLMKKYDRESNVRIWEGTPQKIIRYIMVLFSVYSIYITLFGRGLREVRLTNFLGMILIIGYLNYPARKGHVKVNHIPWYDILIMALGAGGFFYFSANAKEILMQATKITRDPMMVAIAIISILSLMELCRRSVGLPILCVVGALLVYTFSNVRFGKVIYDLFYTTSGVMNTPIDVCAKYIVVFIIFGAFLERTGISSFFIDLANSVAGASAGGPAKVAVISSALCGMVSGSSVGNTVTTGSVTIPMMKKIGYKGEFAGAVEAAASTGGQIMPPIMGAAAFLMAEYLGVGYGEVALRAILPAVLYFVGIYIAVHLEARKLGLKGIPREELPRFSKLIRKIYLLTPLVVLVVLVSTNTRTMQFSAAVAIGVTILVGLINKDDRITVKKFLDALEAGGKGTITVAVACAMAGIVAGCITSTGLASKLITTIVSISGGHAMIALVLTMICCIILGMGVPTTATYCIMAATCAPILTSPEIGIPTMAAHFFVFYFGIVADITPPVALAAYAGSAIAKAPPMKTAVNATRLAIAAFIVPYIMAFSPAILFVDTNVIEVIQICITAVIGVFGVSAGLSGYVYRNMNMAVRVIIITGGLTLLIPGMLTDVIGLVLVAAALIWQRQGRKQAKEAAAES
ncbi:MAG: TRAP transporter permease [Enterocloster sp.]